jgi:regulator of protease activity HflC (stomatin/prohibitin superfamily)
MDIVLGVFLGVVLWFFARYGLGGFYTIGPNERAVLCTFGRAQRHARTKPRSAIPSPKN